jgi:hypothetical protein
MFTYSYFVSYVEHTENTLYIETVSTIYAAHNVSNEILIPNFGSLPNHFPTEEAVRRLTYISKLIALNT